MRSPATGSVLGQDERLSYTSMDLVTSSAAITGAPMVPGSGIPIIFFAKAQGTDTMNHL